MTDTYYGKKYDADTVRLIKYLRRNGRGFDHPDETLKHNPNFKYKGAGMAGNGAFIGANFVVKDPHIAGDGPPPKKYRCPTTVLADGITIQPKVQVFMDLPKRVKNGYIKLGLVHFCNMNECHFLTHGGSDAHDENFGLLNGELKQFDW